MTRSASNPFMVAALAEILDGPARPKGKPPNLQAQFARLMRVVKRAPEVVVKVRPGGKSPGHVRAHLRYITRRGTIEAENERGQKLRDLEDVRQAAREWGFHMPATGTRERPWTINIVLSMPEGTDPRAVLDASRAFAKAEFSANHQYVFALHTDTARPHVHLSIKAQGYDLTWVKRSKADLQRWRENFAQQMRDQGVEAEATPRRARAQVHRGRSQASHHMKAEAGRAQEPAVAGKDAVRERDPPLWQLARQRRQHAIWEAYGTIVQHLEQETRNGAASEAVPLIRGFLASMLSDGRAKDEPQAARQKDVDLQRHQTARQVGQWTHVEGGAIERGG